MHEHNNVRISIKNTPNGVITKNTFVNNDGVPKTSLFSTYIGATDINEITNLVNDNAL